MKNLFFGILVLCFALAKPSAAQDYAFKVMATKGANEIKTGDAWVPLKTGASLKAGDEVKVGENSYLGLVHISGKPLEVKKAGSLKVDELAKQVPAGSSVMAKYADFILSSNSAEAKKNRLSATGAVHRDVTEATAIKLLLPENQHSGVFNTNAVIRWEAPKESGPFVVVFKNMFEEDIAKVETPENFVQVDLSDPKFATQNAIMITVSSKADPKQISKQRLLKKLDPAKRSEVKTSLDEIMGDVADANAFNKYLLAGFYESKGLFIDAIASYEEAIRLAPDVPTFQEGYDEFLIRHGLKK